MKCIWTQKWLLKFNEQKCKMLHLGNNNVKNNYFIGKGDQRIPLEKSELEKDLGIYIDENLNFKEHIKITVKKSNYACYKILKNFTFKDDVILVPLFKSLVRPILEYGNVVESRRQLPCWGRMLVYTDRVIGQITKSSIKVFKFRSFKLIYISIDWKIHLLSLDIFFIAQTKQIASFFFEICRSGADLNFLTRLLTVCS